jgi:hypothetical protein
MWVEYLLQFQGESPADGCKHMKLQEKNSPHTPYLLIVHCFSEGSVLCLPFCGSLNILWKLGGGCQGQTDLGIRVSPEKRNSTYLLPEAEPVWVQQWRATEQEDIK